MSSPTPASGGSNGSSSGSGGSNTSSSGSGGSGSTTSSNSGPSIPDLTTSLKQIEKSGPADVKLSSATRDKYLNIIDSFKTSLQNERNSMNNLETLNSVGDLESAQQTKMNLDLDVTGFEGVQKAVDNYLAYLDQLETTIKKAADRLMQHG